jgi:hypothetical protein
VAAIPFMRGKSVLPASQHPLFSGETACLSARSRAPDTGAYQGSFRPSPCLQASTTQFWESRARSCTLGDPPNGRDKEIMSRKICRRPLMECERFSGSMGFSSGMLHHEHCETKAYKPIHTAFMDSLNQRS